MSRAPSASEVTGVRVVTQAFPCGFAGPGRHGHRVDLDDGVGRAVDGHVEPHAEEVLVVRPVEPGRDERAVLRHLTDGQRRRRDDAGQLDLVLDQAVVVEVPEVAVLVVPDGDDRGDHQPATAADLDGLGAEVGVLPRDPGVLLVHADRVGDDDGLAVLVVDDPVEVVDVPDAVAPEGQRVREPPDAVLALVEDVLEAVRRRRVAVGHVHLGERGAVQHRAARAAVVVGDVVQDEALARGEPDPQVPLLPAHRVPVDGEAGALGLGDVDGLDVVADRLDARHVLRVVDPRLLVVRGVRREVDLDVVLDVDDLAEIEVDGDDETLDRAGRTRARPGRSASTSAAARCAVRSGRPPARSTTRPRGRSSRGRGR